MALPASAPRALVAPCCPVPSSSVRVRIVEPDGYDNFRRYDSFNAQQLRENPNLALLVNQDPIFYLSHYGGFPGLVRGANWGTGIFVVSSNFRHVTEVCSSRVQGNKIKFGHGTSMFLEERASVWEWCVLRHKVELVKRSKVAVPVIPPLVIERENQTDCPACYEPLTGLNVKCENRHQICAPCFRLLSTDRNKKCPMCNIPNYPASAYDLIRDQMATRQETDRFLRFNIAGQNSGYDFKFNEAHFMSILRYMTDTGAVSAFEKMLFSAFFNFWYNHQDRKDGVKAFNVLQQTTGNIRTLRAIDDDFNFSGALTDFLEVIFSKEIYEDVGYTSGHIQYDDIDFFSHLRDLGLSMDILAEYPNQSIAILKRQVYFRYKIKHMTHDQIRELFKSLVRRILTSGAYNVLYTVKEESENLWPDGTSNDEPQS